MDDAEDFESQKKFVSVYKQIALDLPLFYELKGNTLNSNSHWVALKILIIL